MSTNITFTADPEEASVFVMKIFPQSVTEVWKYFAEAEFLEKWWAPKPWTAETREFDFREGGKWLYAMVGPDGDRHYARADFKEITPHRSISYIDCFTDEKGEVLQGLPGANWLIGFTGVEEGTKLTVNIHFASREDLDKVLEMGFEEGFKMALNQLEDGIGQ